MVSIALELLNIALKVYHCNSWFVGNDSHQFNLPNVPYGARLLEPQVGEFSWDRAPPEVVIDAGDKQPGETNEGQQSDERNQHTNHTRTVYINHVSILFNSPGNTWKMLFICSLVSAVN